MHPTQSAIALDESVSNASAKGLRMRGIDVKMSSEEGLIGASDEEQLAYALLQSRVIFTFDDGDR
jgi:predicted nuclease of predicted toxin-antitoxin system